MEVSEGTTCSKTIWQDPKEKDLNEQSDKAGADVWDEAGKSGKQVMQEHVKNFELDFEFNAKSLRSFKQRNICSGGSIGRSSWLQDNYIKINQMSPSLS